jgi:hypothetical protein
MDVLYEEFYIFISRVVSGTEQKNSTSPILQNVVKATKGPTALTLEIDCYPTAMDLPPARLDLFLTTTSF